MDTAFETEKVSQPREVRPGRVREDRFWIAYEPHVAAYGQMHDRITFAAGKGLTQREALEAAAGLVPSRTHR